ncbi:hypothetical protein [Candidatus Chloroploca asiatica]|uniref:hypothetical protein n=1 Tax=Candidatus Chloroploca asiatica TaxID=1506545 RepID=UPI001144CB5B|nr:hypothetical protein [Candidatus Chloroploca asiatica]
MTDLAEMTLSRLTQLRTGVATARGHGVALDPFSIATIIRGTGAMTTLPAIEGGAIHSALEALTRWQSPPDNRRLTDLAQTRIPLGTADVQAGDVLYGHARSRAIWMPRHFMQTQTRASLGCYHRNLVWTALQIDSLGSLVKQGATLIATGKALRGTQRTMLQRAYGILSRFHSGSSEVTYRTLSSKRHLEDNDMIPALNAVRGAFQRPPL